MSFVYPKSLSWRIISYWSIGCHRTIQWWCILEPDSKCKSIVVFAVTWNRYFCRGCESHLESCIVHILVISSFSRKQYYSCFSVLLFRFLLVLTILLVIVCISNKFNRINFVRVSVKGSWKKVKFCLSLHYNGSNSYLFVNGTEII